jgi:cytochrome d ubiquinol oxidase subunit I
MAALSLAGAWRWWQRRRGRGVPLPDDRRFLLAIVLAAPLGFIALEAGWTVTEVGRQPWIVHGIMRTTEAVTPMPGLGITFALFSVLYVGLAIAVLFLLWRQILKTGITPVPLGVTSELPLPSRASGAFPAPKS